MSSVALRHELIDRLVSPSLSWWVSCVCCSLNIAYCGPWIILTPVRWLSKVRQVLLSKQRKSSWKLKHLKSVTCLTQYWEFGRFWTILRQVPRVAHSLNWDILCLLSNEIYLFVMISGRTGCRMSKVWCIDSAVDVEAVRKGSCSSTSPIVSLWKMVGLARVMIEERASWISKYFHGCNQE